MARGPKKHQNVIWGKNTEKTMENRGPKKTQNVIRGETALVQTHLQGSSSDRVEDHMAKRKRFRHVDEILDTNRVGKIVSLLCCCSSACCSHVMFDEVLVRMTRIWRT